MDGHAKPSAAAVSLHTQPIRSEIVSVVIKVLKVLAGPLVALVAVLTLTFYYLQPKVRGEAATGLRWIMYITTTSPIWWLGVLVILAVVWWVFRSWSQAWLLAVLLILGAVLWVFRGYLKV